MLLIGFRAQRYVATTRSLRCGGAEDGHPSQDSATASPSRPGRTPPLGDPATPSSGGVLNENLTCHNSLKAPPSTGLWFFGQRTGTRPPRVSSSRQWARASQPIQMQIDAAAREGSRTGGFYRDGSSRALRTTGVPFPARGGPAQPRQVQISPRGPGEFYFARA